MVGDSGVGLSGVVCVLWLCLYLSLCVCVCVCVCVNENICSIPSDWPSDNRGNGRTMTALKNKLKNKNKYCRASTMAEQ